MNAASRETPAGSAAAAQGSAVAAGRVVVYRNAMMPRAGHDQATSTQLARAIARLKDFDFAGEYEASAVHARAPYFVPVDTVLGLAHANTLGIACEHDLFGGVVPYPFVATKCISHPLLQDASCVPPGWSEPFAERIAVVTLAGFSAFCYDDARRAGERLLLDGPVRVKRALGIGGRGQTVVADRRALEAALEESDATEVGTYGIVLEQDLSAVTTYSVGQVRIGDVLATYYGTQRSTVNNRGHTVYGGSELHVVRGDFEELLRSGPAPAAQRAIEQARAYDAAAFACFEGLIASRRNYDVACGLDPRGRECSGVLEQSWRIGGASGAEIGALALFRSDAAVNSVRATSIEVYGTRVSAPPRATIYFQGNDPEVGPLTKYTVIEPHADA